MALAVSVRADDPFAYVAQAMAEFDARLYADPTRSPEAAIERRIAELLEEAA